MESVFGESVFIRLGRKLLSVWVFVFVLALFPLTEDAAGPVKMLLTHGVLCLVGVLCLLDALLFNPSAPRSSGIVFALPAALMGLLLCAFPVMGPMGQGMGDALRWWLLLLVLSGIFARLYTNSWQVIRFFRVFLWAVCISSLYGLAQRLGLDPMPWGVTGTFEYLNLPATYGNPNFAGHVLVVAILLSFGLAFYLREPFYVLFGVLSGFHLYLTHMRSGWVALVGALAVLFVFWVVRKMFVRPIYAAFVTVVMLVLGCVFVFGSGLYVLAARPELVPAMDSSLQLRLNGYKSAADIFLEHPLSGVGPGRYGEEAPGHWTPFEKKWFALEGKRNEHVHNEVLEFGAEFGLGGVLAYLVFFLGGILGSLLAAGRSRFGEDRFLGLLFAVVLSAVMVDGFFGFNLRVPVSGALCFSIVGLAGGLSARERFGIRGAFSAALLLFSAVVSAWFEVQSFQAEMQYQRAQGARLYALARAGNAEEFGYGVGEAEVSLDRALVWRPWESRYLKLRALVSSMHGDYAGAHVFWLRGLELSPHDPVVLHGVLESALNAGIQSKDAQWAAYFQSEAAQVSLGRLKLLASEWPEYMMLAGRIAEEVEKDAAKARVYYEESLSRGASSSAYLYRSLARIASHRGDAGALEAIFRAMVEVEPGATEAWKGLESGKLPLESPQEWVEMLHGAWMKTRGKPELLGAHVYLAKACGRAYFLMNPGFRELALGILAQTLEVAPNDASLLAAYEELCKVGIEERGGGAASSGVGVSLGVGLSSLLPSGEGKLAELKRELDSLEGASRGFGLLALSEAQAQEGAMADALGSAREAFGLLPEDLGVKLNLARRLSEAGKDTEAVFHYMTLLPKLGAEHPERGVILGELEVLKGRVTLGKESRGE